MGLNTGSKKTSVLNVTGDVVELSDTVAFGAVMFLFGFFAAGVASLVALLSLCCFGLDIGTIMSEVYTLNAGVLDVQKI